MMVLCWIVATCWLTLLPISTQIRTRKPINKELLVDEHWADVLFYLEYEEPDFNIDAGVTTEDFMDSYQGFYTEANRVRSIDWDLTLFGEVPWAGVLISLEHPGKLCGAVLMSEKNVMTPYACVSEKATEDLFEVTKQFLANPRLHEHDLGLDIEAIFDRPSINWDLLNSSISHKITKAVDTLISRTKIFLFTPDTPYHLLWQPVLLEVSPKYRIAAAVPWPGIKVAYDAKRCKIDLDEEEIITSSDPNAILIEKKTDPNAIVISKKPDPNAIVTTKKPDEVPIWWCTTYEEEVLKSELVSYDFSPLDKEGQNKLKDNHNNIILVKNQQVELIVTMCSQRNCKDTTGIHKNFHDYLVKNGELVNLVCWCDHPTPADWVLYSVWEDPEVPHFKGSVYNGLIGSPLVSNGAFAGWLVERLAFSSEKGVLRGTYVRTFNNKFLEKMVSWLEPQLIKEREDEDVEQNRPQMAIHDFKLFVPDPDLKMSELDLPGWAQGGRERFRKHSTASTMVPGHMVFVLSLWMNM